MPRARAHGPRVLHERGRHDGLPLPLAETALVHAAKGEIVAEDADARAASDRSAIWTRRGNARRRGRRLEHRLLAEWREAIGISCGDDEADSRLGLEAMQRVIAPVGIGGITSSNRIEYWPQRPAVQTSMHRVAEQRRAAVLNRRVPTQGDGSGGGTDKRRLLRLLRWLLMLWSRGKLRLERVPRLAGRRHHQQRNQPRIHRL